MRIRSVVVVALLASGSALAVKPDKPGCKDHPLFPTRMPNYFISACEMKEFESYPFKLQKGKTHAVEGKYTFITYSVDDRKDDQTGIAVVGNYENALKKIGGTVADSVPNWWVNGSVVVDGKEVWAEAERGNPYARAAMGGILYALRAVSISRCSAPASGRRWKFSGASPGTG